MNAEYARVCLCKLLKYKKALNNIPDGFDKSPASCQCLFLAREKLNNEIERKKEKYWSFTKPLLITIIGGLIVSIIIYFFFGRANNANILPNTPSQQRQQQPEEDKKDVPSRNQKTLPPTQL